MQDIELGAGVTWVTPTRRLAHHLKLRHDEACLAQGLEVWRSADIVTWQELVQRMFERDRQAGRLEGRWLPSSAAQLVWERIVRRDPALAALVSPGGLGRAAYRSWRRMHSHQIPAHALDVEQRPESRAFARWVDEYQAWLSERGWVDGSVAPKSVTAKSSPARLAFVGFGRLTPAQQDFQARLAAAGIEIQNTPLQPRRGECSWLGCIDRRSEIETAARWAAQRLDEDARARLAIVVPDLSPRRDEVRRIVERVLVPAAGRCGGPAPESAAFELAAAGSLAQRPLAVAALDALDVFAGPCDLAAASRLLRSPFLRAANEEADARAQLDARIRRQEPFDLGLGRLARLAQERGCPAFAEAVHLALEQAGEWPRRALPNRWARLFFDLLAALGWPGADLDSNEHQARARWATLVAEFGACDDYVGPVSAREAAGVLRDLAEAVLFEPEELRAPLLVIDAETCAGMRFDALWVCGLDDARWPPPAAPDPFLPRDWQVQRRLDGCSAEVAEEQARALLQSLAASADEVILSVPQFDDDAPLLPSPLLDGIARREPPALWRAPSLAAWTFAERPVVERLVDGTMPAVGRAEAGRGGARLLELQAACPYRAQVELRLGARALEETEAGLDAAARGDLVHAVLARVWQELRDSQRLRALSDAAAREVVRRAVAAELDASHRAAEGVLRRLLEIEAAWLEERVLELLAQDRARPDFSVESIEQRMATSIGGLTLDLRPDRIDRLADGSFAVVDYKTGADADVKAWLEERPKLPQLPLYATAAGADRIGAVAFARIRAGDTGYAGLARDSETFPGLKSPGAKGWPREFDEWPALLDAWRRRLTALAEEHATGEARLAPDPVHACRYCHLEAVCRIGETRTGRGGEGAGDD